MTTPDDLPDIGASILFVTPDNPGVWLPAIVHAVDVRRRTLTAFVFGSDGSAAIWPDVVHIDIQRSRPNPDVVAAWKSLGEE